jgi:hypothetical protein
MKRTIFYFILLISTTFFCTNCELFVIKGKKIVVEDNAEYTQNTPLGVVTIFLNELNNNNLLAASELLIKEDGNLLNATEKYEKTSELSRIKRFMENKTITSQNLDTLNGNINVNLELDYKEKVKIATKKRNNLFYIIGFERE